jgi:hypothetical protein
MTQHSLSDAQIDRLSGEEIRDLILRLGTQQSANRQGDLRPLLAKVLYEEALDDAVELELETWSWDNGYFPYFGAIKVTTKSGRRTSIELEAGGVDRELCDLIAAEARAYGLGEHSRIRVSVKTGDIEVE